MSNTLVLGSEGYEFLPEIECYQLAIYLHHHQTMKNTTSTSKFCFFFSSILATTIQILKVNGSKNNFLRLSLLKMLQDMALPIKMLTFRTKFAVAMCEKQLCTPTSFHLRSVLNWKDFDFYQMPSRYSCFDLVLWIVSQLFS